MIKPKSEINEQFKFDTDHKNENKTVDESSELETNLISLANLNKIVVEKINEEWKIMLTKKIEMC